MATPLPPMDQTWVRDDGKPTQAFGVALSELGVQALRSPLVSLTFAQLPVTPVIGMVALITDSTTATWGATVAGTGANKVLAWFNGTNWTVIGA